MATKVSINIIDELQYTLHVVRDEEGELLLEKGFLTFHKRPGAPHLTLFTEGEYVEPHFTAHSGGPRPFRRRLARVTPEKLASSLQTFALAQAKQFFSRLQPADLDALESEGWRIHFVNFTAVHRWARLAKSFRLDGRTITALGRHILRIKWPPTALRELQDVRYPLFLALGPNGGARMVGYFPDGFWEPLDVHPANATRVYAPGWYWARLDRVEDAREAADDFEGALGTVLRKIADYLGRFPRRPGAKEPDLGDYTAVLPSVLGFFSSDLLKVLVSVRETADAQVTRRDGAEATPAP